MTFTHLHVHSHYSVLDGMSKVPDLVDKAIKMGMPAIALTDHGCMYGIKELLDYTKKANKKLKEKAKEEGIEYVPFKPIVGVEAYCARRGRLLRDKDLKAPNTEGKSYIVDQSGWHLILLAKNMQGYRNLCKIVSASFMEDSYYRRPRIDRELLEQYHEGLICCSACLGGELPQKIMATMTWGDGATVYGTPRKGEVLEGVPEIGEGQWAAVGKLSNGIKICLGRIITLKFNVIRRQKMGQTNKYIKCRKR